MRRNHTMMRGRHYFGARSRLVLNLCQARSDCEKDGQTTSVSRSCAKRSPNIKNSSSDGTESTGWVEPEFITTRTNARHDRSKESKNDKSASGAYDEHPKRLTVSKPLEGQESIAIATATTTTAPTVAAAAR